MKIDLSQYELEKMWNDFDWPSAEFELLELQKSLTKAEYARNREAVKELQHRIVTSLSAKALAVRHIANNFTVPGVDGVSWRRNAEKMQAVLSLTSKGYKAKPAKHISITEKFTGKERRISVFTCHDKTMQVLYTYALDPIAEGQADFKSFGFRKGRGAHDAHSYLLKAFSFKNPPQYVLCADIKSCYNSISHQWLMKYIPMDKRVLNEFLSAGYIFDGELFPTEQGISLGSNISCVLGNMVLDGLKSYIYKGLHGAVKGIDFDDGNMVRFADDIIVAVRSAEQAMRAKNAIEEFLAPRGLTLSPEKTKIVHVSDGFNFLSRHYVSRNGVMCASPSDKAVQKFEESLRDTILQHNGSQKSLIDLVNRKLVGWANYHRITNAGEVFRRIDTVVQTLLLRASQAKHPKMSVKQVVAKYWYKDNDGRFIYALPTKKECHIIEIGKTILFEHRPVRLEPNPYLDTQYFEERENGREIANVTGDYKAIWKRQGGRCHYCGKPILADQERKVVQTSIERVRAVKSVAYIHAECAEDEFILCQVDKGASSMSRMNISDMLEKIGNDKEHPQKKLIPAYERLTKFFLSQNKQTVTLTFEQIEHIMERPLVPSAAKDNRYWYKNEEGTMSKAWTTQGYAIESLFFDKKKVTFKQADLSRSQVIIPEIFLTQKIPQDAKYEIESFLKYICDKYGL